MSGQVKAISDLHLGHRNICAYRPFDTVEQHNQHVFENVMSSVFQKDTLYILGDFCFTMESYEKYAKQILSITPNVHWILGNHDTDARERREIFKRILVDFPDIKVHSLLTWKSCWLSHAPIHPDELRDKKWNVHGHVHGKSIGDIRYIDISCEAVDYKPVVLLEEIEKRKGSEGYAKLYKNAG